MVNTLGRLKKIDLRTVWINEAGDFTPWLANEANLALLADTIGLELELEATEKNVGPFRADIVCKDTVTDSWVLIENQLERTDHVHLGQLLAYAAGLDAVTIVWIAQKFTDEHRAALDWLNEVTGTSINFFGLEIELWQIGSSEIAPKFNVVSQPNDWTKTVSSVRRAENAAMTETQQLQLEYWQAFRDYLESNNSSIKAQKPAAQHWTNYAVGRSGFNLSTTVNTLKHFIGIGLIIEGTEAKPHFHLLLRDRDVIEAEIGHALEWRELPNKISSRISLFNHSFDPTDRTTWLEQYAWLKENLEAFHRAFSHRVKALNAADYITDLDDQTEDE